MVAKLKEAGAIILGKSLFLFILQFANMLITSQLHSLNGQTIALPTPPMDGTRSEVKQRACTTRIRSVDTAYAVLRDLMML